jgi:hypothetical protein
MQNTEVVCFTECMENDLHSYFIIENRCNLQLRNFSLSGIIRYGEQNLLYNHSVRIDIVFSSMRQ